MSDLTKIPTWKAKDLFHVVVEAPAGSHLKYTYDPDLDAFTVARPLALGLAYPYDWGFVPGTRAPDGDPLDAMVLSTVPSFPGVVHACHALGVVRLSQKESGGRKENDRVIAVPAYTCTLADEGVETDLTKQRRKDLQAFFVNAALMEGKAVRIEGWEGPKAALRLIAQTQTKSP